MDKRFVEENGIYQIDCSESVWATDQIHEPVKYIYVLEYPKGDIVTRKRLRNRMKQKLPFELQNNIGIGEKLIEKVDVLSIAEWNAHEEYGKYPITEVNVQ